MPLGGFVWVLLTIVVILVVAYVAKYLVDNFFPPPTAMPVLALIGIVLLIVLLWAVTSHFGVAVFR